RVAPMGFHFAGVDAPGQALDDAANVPQELPEGFCGSDDGDLTGDPHGSRAALPDDLVRSREERGRNRQAERLCRLLEVDRQIELRRLLDGQLGWLGALQDLVHVDGGTPP